MLRALLAAGLLALALPLLAPGATAQATPICVSEGLGDTTVNTLVCGPGGEARDAAAWTLGRAGCLLNTPPNQWATVCTAGAPSSKSYTTPVATYASCYYNTPPSGYVATCFGS